jgi:hypothetical protein
MVTDTRHTTVVSQTDPAMRVLVAFEELRSVYSDTIARAIGELQPGLVVRSTALGGLEGELEGFDPHVVVCSRPNGDHPGARGTWVRIPTEDGLADEERLAGIWLDGELWRTGGPPLSKLLAVLDETQRRLSEGELSEAC